MNKIFFFSSMLICLIPDLMATSMGGGGTMSGNKVPEISAGGYITLICLLAGLYLIYHFQKKQEAEKSA